MYQATAIFQDIQHAYAVLSDANERKWYDDHREDILSGRTDTAEDGSVDHKVRVCPDVHSFIHCCSGLALVVMLYISIVIVSAAILVRACR